MSRACVDGEIVLTYAVIAPIILPIGSLAFLAFWVANRYYFMFIEVSPGPMAGVFYLEALSQTFVGIYMQQTCLIGLFLLNGRNYLLHVVVTVCGLCLIACCHHHIAKRHFTTWTDSILFAQHSTRAVRIPDLGEQVWLPKDDYGIAENVVDLLKNKASNLQFTTKGAVMSKSGRVVLQ